MTRFLERMLRLIIHLQKLSHSGLLHTMHVYFMAVATFLQKFRMFYPESKILTYQADQLIYHSKTN